MPSKKKNHLFTRVSYSHPACHCAHKAPVRLHQHTPVPLKTFLYLSSPPSSLLSTLFRRSPLRINHVRDKLLCEPSRVYASWQPTTLQRLRGLRNEHGRRYDRSDVTIPGSIANKRSLGPHWISEYQRADAYHGPRQCLQYCRSPCRTSTARLHSAVSHSNGLTVDFVIHSSSSTTDARRPVTHVTVL